MSRKHLSLLVGVAAIGLALGAPAAAVAAPAATGVAVTASSPTIRVGDTVDVVVTATVDDLYAYDLELAFDPAVLAYVDGSAATAITGATTVDPESGTVHVVHTKLGTSPAASGEVTLATLRFTALAAGDGSVTAGIGMVGAAGEADRLVDAGSSAITVAALPDDGGTSTPPPGDGGDGAAPAGDGRQNVLGATGVAIGGWAAGGAVLLAIGVGAVLLARRRAATR